MVRRRAVLCGAAVWLLAGPASARRKDARPAETTLEAKADVIVEANVGDVDLVIETRKDGRVEVTDASLPAGFTVSLKGSARRVEVVVRGIGIASSGRIALSVPERARLDLHTRGGDVSVHGLRGEADVVVVRGDIAIEGAPDRVRASTTSGDVRVVGVRRQAELATVSGDVVVTNPRGDLEANTVSGNVTVSGGALDRSGIAVVSGKIAFESTLGGGNHALAAHSGDIDVQLSSDESVRVRVETFSGDVEDALVDPPVHTRGRHERVLGDAAARLDVATFSGDVRLSPRRAG